MKVDLEALAAAKTLPQHRAVIVADDQPTLEETIAALQAAVVKLLDVHINSTGGRPRVRRQSQTEASTLRTYEAPVVPREPQEP